MRAIFFLFIVFIAIIAYLSYLNPDNIVIHLSKTSSYDIPKIVLILFSILTGALLTLTFIIIKDTKNLFYDWRRTRRQRKEAKIQELYAKGLSYLLGEKTQQAIPIFHRVLDIETGHIKSLLHLGDIYRKTKNFSEAIHYHQRAKNLENQNIEVMVALARDFEEAGRPEEAIEVLKEILKVDESNIAALTKIRDLYEKMGRWEEACDIQLKVLNSSLKEANRSNEQRHLVELKYETGRLYLSHGEKDRAKKFFKEAIKQERNFVPAYVELGEVLIKENKAQEAADLWEKAYNGTSSIIFLHRLEDLYLELGEPERIINFYHKVLERKPDDITLRFYLGKLYYRLEMIDASEEALSDIDIADKNIPHLHMILGNIHARRGEMDKAAEEFKKAMNLKKPVVVPYYCPICDYHTTGWSGRCPRCGNWNTLDGSPIFMKKDQTPLVLKEIVRD